MSYAFNTQALKKATNVSINSDLLLKAKKLKINLSATLEAALIEKVNIKQRELWKQKNQEAVDAYNQQIAEKGVFSDGLKLF